MTTPSSSLLSHLECSACGTVHDAGRQQNLCTVCGRPLLARYALAGLDGRRWRESLRDRPWSLWRYADLLPIARLDDRVSLGEVVTPLLALPRTAARLGLTHLLAKDEGLLPTGSFKARGAAVGISRARELGVTHVALPTAGNAGGAWATYAARAGMRATVVMPEDAPAINVREAVVSGASVYLVRGLISDAGAMVSRYIGRAREVGEGEAPFDAATLREPYRIEGKKTMGFELAEQHGWSLPDVILYPCGGGVGLIGIWKAFDELEAIGAIGPERPRLIAVQAEGCAPIVKAWEDGVEAAEPWPNARTIASGIRVPRALGDRLILRALRETKGCAVAVSDDEITTAVYRTAADDGLFLSPEGAATVAALPLLREHGLLDRGERIVLFNTGAGIKYPEVVRPDAPLLDPSDDLPL